MCRHCAVIALTLFICAGNGTSAAPQDSSDQAALDAEELGVSLARIKHRLDRLPEAPETRSLLRLNFYIEVYGHAPQRNHFQGFDLHNSPVPYGPPTHDQLTAVMRGGDPQLRPPAINLNNVIGWALKLSR